MPGQNGAGLIWCMRLLWCTMILHLLLVFRIRINLCCTTQKWPSYVAQAEPSPHNKFCRRNRRSFASKCFFHEQISLELARLRGPSRSIAVFFRDHEHRSMIRYLWLPYKCPFKHRIVFFQNFCAPFHTNPFWAVAKLCVIHREQTVVAVRARFMQYRMYAGGRNTQGCLYLTVTWRSCIISSHTAPKFSGTTTFFGRPSSADKRRPRWNSLNQFFTVQ